MGFSTNLDAAFKAIYETSIKSSESPKALIVISDMEIDSYFRPNKNWDFMQTVRWKFANAGLKSPKLIMWNVEARNDTFLTKDEDVILVSGQSPAIFKRLCDNLSGKTNWEIMLETLNDKAYDCVSV